MKKIWRGGFFISRQKNFIWREKIFGSRQVGKRPFRGWWNSFPPIPISRGRRVFPEDSTGSRAVAAMAA
jgi:hypothetical protein